MHHEPDRRQHITTLGRPAHVLQLAVRLVTVVIDSGPLDQYVSSRCEAQRQVRVNLSHLIPSTASTLNGFRNRPLFAVISFFLGNVLDNHLDGEVDARFEHLEFPALTD